ncbi:TerB family tellurite resistance protein [Maritimibacter sp. HL-12]|uniref:tellurite resistance TerB family protein n=1 Tax=Maritimibacter sp. HL-12 TaxID=1162418 RepID=UPI000A0F3DA0|nr:TerB family tellurite resistance protein [Maritimibacter sp. HL-12]SMH34924.1 Uncharacterized conserved protein, tellurite resistance protein B (TerB) family [Maritimibacter sp. HL-12]
MFTEFLNRLRGIRPETPLPPLDARLASGALLVRIAKADSQYVFEEIAMIDRILARAHGLNPVEAAKLRATCEKLEAQAPDTGTFTGMVQNGVAQAARAELVEAMRQVALADRALNPEEEALLAEIDAAFGIAPEAGSLPDQEGGR